MTEGHALSSYHGEKTGMEWLSKKTTGLHLYIGASSDGLTNAA